MNPTSLTERDLLRTDWQMLVIQLLHVPVVGLLIPIGFDTKGFALVAAIVLGALMLLSYYFLRGTRACSLVNAAGLMLFSAIMIQAQLGRIEMHFHIFAALALVIIYRDWLPVAVAAVTIAVHHLLLTAVQNAGTQIGTMPLMIFDHDGGWAMAFLHAAFVVFEAVILMFFAIRMGRERRESHAIIDMVQAFERDKDLSLRLDESAGKTEATTAFNTLLDQFSDLIGMLHELISNLRASGAELTEFSRNTAQVSERQQNEVDQMAESATEMVATVNEVARNAQMAAEVSSGAVSAVQAGRSNSRETVSLIGRTNDAMRHSEKSVRELVEQVRSITDALKSIDAISEQTNLLALNAAIEAARAGEHGRGFSVVADEVRSLSGRTREFTQDISGTVDGLAKLSATALHAIESGKTLSEETDQAVAEVGHAIDRIQTAIDELSSMNQQVATAAEEQTATSEQISQGIRQVAVQNEQVVDDAGRTRDLAVNLDELVQRIEMLVGRYSR